MRLKIWFGLGLLWAGCAAPLDVHLQDRHGLATPAVETYATSHSGLTLVMLDYHHDSGLVEEPLSSVNWLGHLLVSGRVQHVLWVSGRNLKLPNRNSRLAWLDRSLAQSAPSLAQAVKAKIRLLDWPELEVWQPTGPVAVSLDLDLLTKDPGDPPERFLDELAGWTARVRPGLVTVALSSAYQPDPGRAWSWLGRWLAQPWPADTRFFLDGGPLRSPPESLEEQTAWSLWTRQPDRFQFGFQRFWPNGGLWAAAPREIRQQLMALKFSGTDPVARDLLAAWTPTRLAFEQAWPQDRLDRLRAVATKALTHLWAGPTPTLSEPEAQPQGDHGLAIRLLAEGVDRGCLAFYQGVASDDEFAAFAAQAAARDPRYPPVRAEEAPGLQIEVSVFGPWTPMTGPEDFVPGVDSLLLDDRGNTTLLQASLAVERGYDRRVFLEHLARKAGLGTDGWKAAGVHFRKAATVWSLGAYPPVGDEKKVKK